ncbi:hypothetical protein Tco_0890528 [Tanacetum coccineum]|uniref:Uncharacterized protein n=1 Tax=Tanacetum coccineum TaxID=301880 RepID=A0ABQ5C0Q2_9ASTR
MINRRGVIHSWNCFHFLIRLLLHKLEVEIDGVGKDMTHAVQLIQFIKNQLASCVLLDRFLGFLRFDGIPCFDLATEHKILLAQYMVPNGLRNLVFKSLRVELLSFGFNSQMLLLEERGAVQQGPVRARVLNDLSAEEKERESQLYDEFEHFRQIKGENIQGYYVRFTKLINDMRNIKMTMSRMQLNSKFVNNMLPEWSRFITEVKLNRGLKESNCDQLYAYLKQHEAKADFKEKMLLMQAQESGAVLDEEQSLFLAKNKFTNVDDDVDDFNRGGMDLALNHHMDEYHDVHEMQNDVQHNYVVDSDADYTSDSNITPYDQYVEDNEEHVVQCNASSVQSRLTNKPDMLINDSVTSELARYKELVGEYEKRAKFELTDRERKIDEQMRIIISDRNRKETSLKSELHSAQILLSSTVDHYKSKTEEVKLLKKDFKQKEDKFLEEFLDLKKIKDKIEDRLYKQEDTRELAEITRKRMLLKMQSPLCVENKIRISPPDYSKENLLATFAPQRNLTPEQIFWSIDDNRKKAETLARKPISTLTVYPPNTPVKLVPRILPTKSQVKINLYVLTQLFTEFDKTCKTRITPSGLTEGERGFEQTKRCYLTEVIPFFKTLKEHFVGVQTALFKEVKEMEKIFDQMNNEVDQNSVDKQCAEIEKKNLLIENENLIVNCLSTQLLYDVAKSRCLDLEADMSKVHDESKLISKLEREYLNLQLKYQHLQESFDNKKSQASQEAPDFRSFFKIKNLEHQIQEKDNVIGHLKDLVTNVNDRSREPHSAVDVTALIEQNDCVRIELEKVKQHYKELYDSIKIARAHTSEKTSTMLNEIESLKAQLRSKEPCFTSDYVKPKVLAPGMSTVMLLGIWDSACSKHMTGPVNLEKGRNTLVTWMTIQEFTWVKILRSKDETPEFVTTFINQNRCTIDKCFIVNILNIQPVHHQKYAEEPTHRRQPQSILDVHHPSHNLVPGDLRSSSGYHRWHPSRPVSTRKQFSIRSLCAFPTELSKVEPKNFKMAVIEDCWFQAMQDEIHEFDRLKKKSLSSQPEGLKTRKILTHVLSSEEGLYGKSSTKGVVLGIRKDNAMFTNTYADSDHADVRSRRSTSEVPVSWSIDWLLVIKKQRSMAISTTKAEYIAMSGCCAQILWMRFTAKTTDLTSIKFLCTIVNKSAILLCCNNVSTLSSKHIDKRHISSESKWKINTMAEQNVPTQPPTRTDEQIVPRSQWLTIGKSNLLFNAQKIQRNPIFQISVDILSNTNFFQAFTALANVPAIYLQPFWNTMKYNEKTGLPPSGNTVIDFVNELGYLEPVEIVSNIRVNYVYQPWRAILTLINQCLTGKTSGSDKPRHPVLQMLWGIVTQTNVDFGTDN